MLGIATLGPQCRVFRNSSGHKSAWNLRELKEQQSREETNSSLPALQSFVSCELSPRRRFRLGSQSHCVLGGYYFPVQQRTFIEPRGSSIFCSVPASIGAKLGARQACLCVVTVERCPQWRNWPPASTDSRNVLVYNNSGYMLDEYMQNSTG
jgi:hypothetical protein